MTWWTGTSRYLTRYLHWETRTSSGCIQLLTGHCASSIQTSLNSSPSVRGGWCPWCGFPSHVCCCTTPSPTWSTSRTPGSPRWQEVSCGWCQWCGFQSRVWLTVLAGGKLWLVSVVWVPVTCWQEVSCGWCQWCGFQSRVWLTALAGGKLWLVPVVWVPVTCLAHRAGRR